MEEGIMGNLRQKVAEVFPARLESAPADFAYQVAVEWAENNPGVDSNVQKTAYGATLGDGEYTVVRQTQFTEEDVDWYLTRLGVANKSKIAELIDRNLGLISTAKAALPNMGYFLQTLETEQRMKKPVYEVQPCIQIAVHHSGITLPVALVEYVLYDCPLYGTWLEQHIDTWYNILRSS